MTARRPLRHGLAATLSIPAFALACLTAMPSHAGTWIPVSYTHLTLPTIYSV